MPKTPTTILAIILMTVFVSTVFAAQDLNTSRTPRDYSWETAYLNVGGYLAAMSSGFRIGGSNLGLGIDLDVEEFLGLDTNDTALRIDAGYRFGQSRRHKVDFSWFSFKRSGTKYIDTQIEIPPELGGGTVGPGNFKSKFNFDIYKLKYEYSFIFDERLDVNAGIGLFIMPMEFGFDAIVSGVLDERVEESVTAPLPVLGIGFDLAITPKWIVKQQVDLFYLEVGDFKGTIVGYNLALEWNTWEHLGFGLGLDTLRVNVESQGSDYPGIDFTGDVKFAYFGLQIYLKAYF